MSSLWEPPTCVNGEAEYTTASSSDTSNYDDNGTDGSSPGLSGGAVAGIAVVGLSSFIVFLLLLRYVGHRRSQKIAATASASAPALPLQRIQIRDQAPPRAQTPPPSYLPAHPPPYSEMPLDTDGPKD